MFIFHLPVATRSSVVRFNAPDEQALSAWTGKHAPLYSYSTHSGKSERMKTTISIVVLVCASSANKIMTDSRIPMGLCGTNPVVITILRRLAAETDVDKSYPWHSTIATSASFFSTKSYQIMGSNIMKHQLDHLTELFGAWVMSLVLSSTAYAQASQGALE